MPRFFTFHTGHYPNEIAYTEVREDGTMHAHYDDGRVVQHTDERKVPAIEACLRYVEAGMWIELQPTDLPYLPRTADRPLTGAHTW